NRCIHRFVRLIANRSIYKSRSIKLLFPVTPMNMPEDVDFRLNLQHLLSKCPIPHTIPIAPNSIQNPLRRAMSYQHIQPCWNLLPMPPNLLPILHKGPIAKTRGVWGAPELYPFNLHRGVEEIM